MKSFLRSSRAARNLARRRICYVAGGRFIDLFHDPDPLEIKLLRCASVTLFQPSIRALSAVTRA